VPKYNPQVTQKPPALGGFLLVAGIGLLCSNQTRLLACHASQTVFFAKPAAKNPALRAFCRRETTAAASSSPSEQTAKIRRSHPIGWLLLIWLRGLDLNQ